MKRITLLLMLFVSIALFAQEGEGGMWMPNTIKQVENDMQQMGLQLTAEDIWNNNDAPSIKDAVVQFGNGCTGEIMSDKGLVFTNHHCGYDAIQKLSTLEHNYLEDGFWSKSFEEELPAEGVTITFIDDMVDVTDVVFEGVTDNMSAKEKEKTIKNNIEKLKKATKQDKFHSIRIKPFFMKNKYFMIKRTTFFDIRLVGTPPAALGKFGGDTDNWMWPRHTIDFSIFRIYADANNQPTMYSKENKPYKPKKFFKINLDDLKEDDFTMVVGFPGRTSEYLTSYEVAHKQDISDPAHVDIREMSLAIMDKNMAKDPALKLKLASKHAGLANYWKFFIGESQGLKKFHAVEAKQKYEADFMKRVNANPEFKAKYGNVLPRLKELFGQLEPYLEVETYMGEIFGRNMDLPNISMIAGMLAKNASKQGENADKYYKMVKVRYLDYLKTKILKDFDANTDKQILAALLDFMNKNIDAKYISPEIKAAIQGKTTMQLADELYAQSAMTSLDKLTALFNKATLKEFTEAVNNDPAYKLFNAQNEWSTKTIDEPTEKVHTEITSLMSKYMKGQMEVFSEKPFYPDANFTMRVAYGKVKGFEPRDGNFYPPFTHAYGVLEKYKPGDLEFDLPKDMIALLQSKEYGKYASPDGKMVVDFLSTNHITGGNSGSPVINSRGEHIGLAFDGVWEGLMEDVYFRPEVSRSITVKDNAVLFMIDKYGHCDHIMNELVIVSHKGEAKQDKKKKKKRKKFLGIF
jgi:hypothetical protein